MSIGRELDPIPEHRIRFAFKHKREHIAKLNMPNCEHPNQHIDLETPHCSRYHAIMPDILKLRLILTLIQQTKDVVLLTIQKGVMLASKEVDAINKQISMTPKWIFT